SPEIYQGLEVRHHENLDVNLQQQIMHDRQAEMFDPNGFSFTGVHITRLKDKPKARLSAQNPTRKVLNYRMEREKTFDSRYAMLQSVVQERDRRVKDDPNVCGKLKIQAKDAIFSEHKVDDFASTIESLAQEGESVSQAFAYDTRYFYNSGLNGLSYTEDGKKVTVDGCVCSPWDRSGLDLHSARLSETKDKKSIFYAGRPDTDKRLELQGIDIFLNELATGHNKGFVHKENDVIELHYIIDSLSTTTQGVGQIAALKGALDEGKSIEWERAAIKKARKNNKPIKVVHNGKTYHVLLRPIQVHNSVSFFASYNFLEFSVEDQINRNGYKKLVELYQSRLKNQFIKLEWQPVAKEIIDELGKHKDSTKIDAGMRIAMIDMLSKICNLPIVHHCKSVVDRTTGAAAVSIVNQMLFDRKFDLVGESFIKTVESELYKHLFVRALKSQLPVSSDVRSAVNINGTINTKRVLPGLEWHTGDTMVAFGFSKLMPEEALRKIPTWKKVGVYVVTLLAFLPSLFLSLVVRAVTLNHVIIPIILPTWLKPKYSFDHHSELLSEEGTRPVLNGPHNSDIKKRIKNKDPTVNFLLARKSELEAQPVKNQPSVDPIPAFKVQITSKLMDDYYQAVEGGIDKDFYRSTGLSINGEIISTTLIEDFRQKFPQNLQRLEAKIQELAPNNPKQQQYLSDLFTQKYQSVQLGILLQQPSVKEWLKKIVGTEEDVFATGMGYTTNLDEEKKVVTTKILFNIGEVQSLAGGRSFYGLEVDASFPFDHTKEFDIHFNFLSKPQLIYRKRSIENGIREDALKALKVAQSKSSRHSASCRRRASARRVSDSV
ncbi:MAG: hypothetical protein KGQ54_03700, partial [Verrucomicrobia bacterium]|nr:hypothetical protein [Verrucomicrobiota bacterium]